MRNASDIETDLPVLAGTAPASGVLSSARSEWISLPGSMSPACGDAEFSAVEPPPEGRQFRGILGKLLLEGVFLVAVADAVAGHIAACWRHRRLF
jgi:hypothetical protein